MAQLTGNFQGTSGTDTFSGSIEGSGIGFLNTGEPADLVVVDGVQTATAVKQVIIDTFEGSDTIEANTDFSSTPFQPLLTIGMTNADINTGSGADTVNISSTGRTQSDATSVGLQNAFIETEDGRDIVTIVSDTRAQALGTGTSTSTGARLANLSMGRGSDTIQIDSLAFTSGAEGRGTPTDTGIDQSILSGGQGSDTIIVNSVADGVSDERGAEASSTGASGASSIKGDDGRDTITLSATAKGGSALFSPSIAKAQGISGGTFVEGGNGADSITIEGSASAGAVVVTSELTGGTAQAYGAIDSFVNGGNGRDTIKISSFSDVGGPSDDSLSYGIDNTTVNGGNGSDLIQITASGSSDGGGSTRYGAVRSTINGGLGSDTIEVIVEPYEDIRASVGAISTTINGGDGADTIKTRGVALDIQASLILGGAGDDILDIGVGNGSVLGGTGNDTLRLDFFDKETMTIEQAGANGLRLTGQVDKLGSASDNTGQGLSWIQSVFEVESYEVAGTTYDAAGVVSLLG